MIRLSSLLRKRYVHPAGHIVDLQIILMKQQLAESDFAAQARQHAAQLGQNIQVGARGAADSFNRFVEGSDVPSTRRARAEPERKDFWDDFASLGAQDNHRRNTSRSGALGTTAMKPGPGASSSATASTSVSSGSGSAPVGSGTGTGRGSSPTPASRKSQDEGAWDDNW
jgi:ADP-ribosylation factor GTPase-activating protein 1